VAAQEAEAFRRKIPNADPGLLFLLAMGALDKATYGLAGMASSWARSAMSKTVTSPPQWTLWKGRPVPPNPFASGPTETTNLPLPLALTVAEALKKGLRDAGDAGREAIKRRIADGGAASDGVSGEARVDFFVQQQDALANSKESRQKVLRDALAALRPLLRTKNPRDAASAMQALAEGFEHAAGEALKTQADETRFHWMRFLAQTELGSLPKEKGAGPDGEALADLGTALDRPQEHKPLPRYDGLLDLQVSLDYHSPRETLKITGARMNGVTRAMARSLSLFPLGDLLKRGLIMRANLKAHGRAVMPVVAVFEGERIDFADETGSPGDEARWLSKLDGYIGRPSPERQRRGALVLRDRLKAQTLKDLGLHVETDEA
jgi:hypothetical protein